jgi:hypothetical protein
MDVFAAATTLVRDRESVANYQMSTREEEFTDVRPFTLFVGTWNVNGQSPGTLILSAAFKGTAPRDYNFECRYSPCCVDILVRIWGTAPLTYGSGSGSDPALFVSDFEVANKK